MNSWYKFLCPCSTKPNIFRQRFDKTSSLLCKFFIWWSTAYHRSIAHQNEKKDYPLLFCTDCGLNCSNPDIFFECFLQFNFLSFAFLSRIIYILMRTTYKSIFSWYWYLFRCIDVPYILFLTGSFVLLYNQLV